MFSSLRTLFPLSATVVSGLLQTSTKAPAQPAQQAAAPVQAGATPQAAPGTPPLVTPQGQLPPQTQAHMPIQSPTPLQVKAQAGRAPLQPAPQVVGVPGLQPQVCPSHSLKCCVTLLYKTALAW